MGAGCLGFGSKSSPDGGVWKSTDAGLTFVQSTSLPTAKGVDSIASVNVLDFAFDPQDRYALYLGTRSNGMLFSYNGGQTWMQPREEELQSGSVLAVEVDPTDKCTLYAIKSTRFMKSEDCGRTWDTEMYVETRPEVYLTDIEVDFYDPQSIWMTSNDGDVWLSIDGGESWNRSVSIKGPATGVMIDNADSRIVYVSTERRGIWRTDDKGENWVDLQDNLEDRDGMDVIKDMAQDASGEVLMLATEYGLIRSTDNGDTWERLRLLTSAREVNIPVLAIDPYDPNVIYYATSATFYSSKDGGSSWQTREMPTGKTATFLAIDPENTNILYLGGATFE